MEIQWNLAITNFLGAMRKVCYSEVFVVMRSILIEIQKELEIPEPWEQVRYIRDFIIVRFVTERLHCKTIILTRCSSVASIPTTLHMSPKFAAQT